MEPDDIPVHDLLGVGDELPPGPDDLRKIVARAGRLRTRMAAAGMVVALGAGAGIGYAVSNHPSHSVQTASSSSPNAGSSSSGSSGIGAVFGGVSAGGGSSSATLAPFGGFKLTALFNRTVGSVTIRGFESNIGQANGAVTPSCFSPGPSFQAEVSTSKMVGIASTGFLFSDATATGSSVISVVSQLVGVAEGDPVAVVAVHTGSNVASVTVQFDGAGADSMAPVKGWAALASPDSSLSKTSNTSTAQVRTVGTLTAFNSTGKQLFRHAVDLGYNSLSPTAAPKSLPSAACLPPPCNNAPSLVPPRGLRLPSTQSGAATINPGGPMIPSSRAGSAIACPMVHSTNGESHPPVTVPTPASP